MQEAKFLDLDWTSWSLLIYTLWTFWSLWNMGILVLHIPLWVLLTFVSSLVLNACALHASDLRFSFLEVQQLESVNAWSKRKCGCRVRRPAPNRITCPPTSLHTVHVYTPLERDLHLDLYIWRASHQIASPTSHLLCTAYVIWDTPPRQLDMCTPSDLVHT